MNYDIYRVIVQHMDEFQGQAKQVVWHIPSKYAKEMATKTEVVTYYIIDLFDQA